MKIDKNEDRRTEVNMTEAREETRRMIKDNRSDSSKGGRDRTSVREGDNETSHDLKEHNNKKKRTIRAMIRQAHWSRKRDKTSREIRQTREEHEL